jgi:hypothetical protein
MAHHSPDAVLQQRSRRSAPVPSVTDTDTFDSLAPLVAQGLIDTGDELLFQNQTGEFRSKSLHTEGAFSYNCCTTYGPSN